jgi:hypothetical protein
MVVRMCDVCQNKIPDRQVAYQLSLYNPNTVRIQFNPGRYDITYSEVCEHCAQQIHDYLRELGKKEVK